MDRRVTIFASDPALLSALQFSLTIEGFDVRVDAEHLSGASCLIIDQRYHGDGLAWLAGLRARGNASPAILLVTHPDRTVRASATALCAQLIEKPLTGNELADALTASLTRQSAV